MRSSHKMTCSCQTSQDLRNLVHVILYLRALLLVYPRTGTVFYPAGETVITYPIWHTLLSYKYQTLMMFMMMVTVWANVLKAKGQK